MSERNPDETIQIQLRCKERDRMAFTKAAQAAGMTRGPDEMPNVSQWMLQRLREAAHRDLEQHKR